MNFLFYYAEVPEWSNMIAHKNLSAVWARLVAHASFDGNINENPNKSGARVRFYSKDSEKLMKTQKIIKEEIGILPYKNYAFEERNKLLLRYNNTSFARKLIDLGAPSGDKAIQSYRVPDWIKYGSKEKQVQYLAALIDDEAESIRKEKKNTLRGLKIKQSKWIKYKKDLNLFLQDLKEIFTSLGIKTGKITINSKDKYYRKDGKITIPGWFRISLNKENQQKLIKVFVRDSQKIRAIID